MIVTRQRPKKKTRLPILLPIAAIAMLTVALTWPPSRNFIVNGPLRPVSSVVISAWSIASRPLTFAYQQQQLTDRNMTIQSLNTKLDAKDKQIADRDAQVKQLQKQVTAMQSQPDASTTAAPLAGAARPSSGNPGDIAAAGSAASADPAIRRAAAQWTAMDPEAAAKLVATLPQSYVAQVFAQMSPDAVGAVLDALPPKAAAGIIQSGGAQGSPSLSR